MSDERQPEIGSNARGEIMRWLVLMALLFTSATLGAAEWVSLDKLENGKKETFVDVSSIRIEGKMRSTASKVTLASHTVTGAGERTDKWIHEIAYIFTFDCGERSSRIDAMTTYFDDGTTWSEPASAFPKPWVTVPPGFQSNWTALMQFVCTWKPK
jgi:hypothetical protein